MTKWRYSVLILGDAKGVSLEGTLAWMGSKGWELVAVVPKKWRGNYFYAFFKRPLEQEIDEANV